MWRTAVERRRAVALMLPLDVRAAEVTAAPGPATTWPVVDPPAPAAGRRRLGARVGGSVAFEPPFPCHAFFLGNGKYGLIQLQNISRLPTRGALVITAPLPIVEGSGSPARVPALVQR